MKTTWLIIQNCCFVYKYGCEPQYLCGYRGFSMLFTKVNIFMYPGLITPKLNAYEAFYSFKFDNYGLRLIKNHKNTCQSIRIVHCTCTKYRIWCWCESSRFQLWRKHIHNVQFHYLNALSDANHWRAGFLPVEHQPGQHKMLKVSLSMFVGCLKALLSPVRLFMSACKTARQGGCVHSGRRHLRSLDSNS